eukprot:1156350-Pelagomonas_calceolata.AAC.18
MQVHASLPPVLIFTCTCTMAKESTLRALTVQPKPSCTYTAPPGCTESTDSPAQAQLSAKAALFILIIASCPDTHLRWHNSYWRHVKSAVSHAQAQLSAKADSFRPGGALRALAVLRKPSCPRELVYRFAPALMADAPEETVDALVAANPPLEPSLLSNCMLPAPSSMELSSATTSLCCTASLTVYVASVLQTSFPNTLPTQMLTTIPLYSFLSESLIPALLRLATPASPIASHPSFAALCFTRLSHRGPAGCFAVPHICGGRTTSLPRQCFVYAVDGPPCCQYRCVCLCAAVLAQTKDYRATTG